MNLSIHNQIWICNHHWLCTPYVAFCKWTTHYCSSQRGTKSLSQTFTLNVPSWWNDLPNSIWASSRNIWKHISSIFIWPSISSTLYSNSILSICFKSFFYLKTTSTTLYPLKRALYLFFLFLKRPLTLAFFILFQSICFLFYLLYVTLDHKTSHKGTFFLIEIYIENGNMTSATHGILGLWDTDTTVETGL